MALSSWVLPIGVTSSADLSHLQRELEMVDNFLRQNNVAKQGGNTTQLPKTSQIFIDITAANKWNVLNEPDRQELATFLLALKSSAPILHISFNGIPSPLFLQKLCLWLREHIHKYVIIQIGRHPNIGAGCAVRTNNKYFDFSLRQRFTDTYDVLIGKIRELEPAPPPPQPVATEKQPA